MSGYDVGLKQPAHAIGNMVKNKCTICFSSLHQLGNDTTLLLQCVLLQCVLHRSPF